MSSSTLLETLHLEHHPKDYDVHVALFEDVRNASFLQEQLLAGNEDFEYAFIDAQIIISRSHVLAAAYRAINDLIACRLKTRNVHSETVFCLSPSNNIAESFRRFGITPTTTNLLAIKVSTPSHTVTAEQVQAHLAAAVEGHQITLTNEALKKYVDEAKVRRYYKLNSAGGGKKQANGVNGQGLAGVLEVDSWRELEVQILGTMALRGAS